MGKIERYSAAIWRAERLIDYAQRCADWSAALSLCDHDPGLERGAAMIDRGEIAISAATVALQSARAESGERGAAMIRSNNRALRTISAALSIIGARLRERRAESGEIRARRFEESGDPNLGISALLRLERCDDCGDIALIGALDFRAPIAQIGEIGSIR